MPLKGAAKKAYQLAWISKRRQQWIDDNGPCAQCKGDIDLEVDHIDPKDKHLNPSQLWSLAPDNLVRVAELAKCQVLCRQCHLAKTATYRQDNQVHGLWMYTKYKCKCNVCTAAKQADSKKHRK